MFVSVIYKEELLNTARKTSQEIVFINELVNLKLLN